ncbi:MAG: hypothetical protein IAF02_21350, partial [Anaerolineae bacterium]|nr:hypothetical protein [Anaerolineae bacterium]
MKLVYEVCLHPEIDIGKHLQGVFPDLPSQYRADVYLSGNRMELRYPQSNVVLRVDTKTGELQYINNHREQFAIIEGWFNLARTHLKSRDKTPINEQVTVSPLKPTIAKFGKRELNLSGYKIQGSDQILSIFGGDLEVGNQLVEALWLLLLPVLKSNFRPSGIPFEAKLHSFGENKSLSSFKLVAIKNIQQPIELTVPSNFKALTLTPQTLKLANRTASRRNNSLNARRLEAERLRNNMIATHTLRGEGQHCAFVFQQPYLDLLRDAVNAISRALGSYESVSSSEHRVRFDWWPDIERRLNFTDNAMAVRALKRLLLFKTVAEADSLPDASDDPRGLSASEQAAYRAIMNAAEMDDACLGGLEACRLTHFIREFPVSSLRNANQRLRRRDELADLLWESFTKPQLLEIGPTRHFDEGDWFTLSTWDMEYRIDFNHEPVIESITLQDGRIRLVVALDWLSGTFDYSFYPSDTTEGWVCIIASLGLCGLLASNLGTGYFNVNDVRLVLDLIPQLKEGKVNFNVVPDEEASELDANVWTIGWNPAADIVHIVAELFGNLFDLFAGEFLDVITDEVGKLINEPWLTWPAIWNAVSGPDLRATAGIIRADGVILEADVSRRISLSGRAAPVDPTRIDFAGFVFSPTYLNEWLSRRLPAFDRVQRLSGTDFASGLGVALPDPEIVEEPEEVEIEGTRNIDIPGALGCGDPPPAPPPVSSNVLNVWQYAPTITVPSARMTPLPVAGRFSMVFRYELQAERTIPFYRATLIQEPCLEDFESPGSDFPVDPHNLLDVPDLSPFGLRNRAQAFENIAQARSRLRYSEEYPSEGRLGIPRPDAPSGGPIPEFPDFPLGVRPHRRICPPPYCDWDLQERRIVLIQYLTATLVVEADVIAGFSGGGDWWLPELDVGLVRNGDGIRFSTTLRHLDTEAELDGVTRDLLETTLTNDALLRATALLGGFETTPLFARHLLSSNARLGLGW